MLCRLVTVAKALWRPAHECVTKFLATRHQHRAKAWGRKSAPTREGTYSPAQTNPGERRNQEWCFPRKDMTVLLDCCPVDESEPIT